MEAAAVRAQAPYLTSSMKDLGPYYNGPPKYLSQRDAPLEIPVEVVKNLFCAIIKTLMTECHWMNSNNIFMLQMYLSMQVLLTKCLPMLPKIEQLSIINKNILVSRLKKSNMLLEAGTVGTFKTKSGLCPTKIIEITGFFCCSLSATDYSPFKYQK